MDAKDLRTGAALGDRSNDGNTKYAQGSSLPCYRNKAYQDIGPSAFGKVEGASARPCAVIGPDRVVPPPAPAAASAQAPCDAYLKGPAEQWFPPDNTYRCPPDYPHKLLDYQHSSRNISPRQTFQENMQRIMVPRSYNDTKLKEDQNNQGKTNNSQMRNKNVPTDSNPKYCDVPYIINPVTDPKNVRNSDMSVTNMNSVLAQSASHGWPPTTTSSRSTKLHHQDMCQYPEYPSCAGPRAAIVNRPQKATIEEPGPMYTDAFYHDGNIRYKPYPSPPVKERYPQTRYDYINNYPNPFHPPPFPNHKYELQKPLPHHPYPSFSQIPFKFLDSRMTEPVINGYQRSFNQQNAYNMPFRNQIIHPTYGPVHGNCLPPNKYYPYPPDIGKAMPPNKLPYDANSKMYADYESNLKKNYPIPEGFYINDIPRPQPTKGPILPPNYPPNMHAMPTHPYYRKDVMKGYEYSPHFRNMDPTIRMNGNPLSRFPTQFSPSAMVSPAESNASLETSHTQGTSLEDCGYVSQSSTASMRSIDSAFSRVAPDYYRRYDHRYGPNVKNSTVSPRLDQNACEKLGSKGKKDIDVRQFLQMWNEGEDEGGENMNKEMTPKPVQSNANNINFNPNQEQLYVLGLVDVPSEELSKYEHIQKVSKLPENIKGYNNIELLHQFEEVIESSKLSQYNKVKSPSTKDFHNAMKSTVSLHGISIPSRPISPLDVEAKISQSVIHKEVGCNFEIKPCSPKMLHVEVATPIPSVIGERLIEKVTNPLMIHSPMIHNTEVRDDCNLIKSQDCVASQEKDKVASCKMVNKPFGKRGATEPVKTNYSIQDLESNSGVCLASLPRLDNDIELTFPEVNQQFINANKVESVTAPASVKDLSLEEIDRDESEYCNQERIVSYTLNANNDFSKLSKYRKLKRKRTELNTPEANIQAQRTDSVIIKNPDNCKSHDDIELKFRPKHETEQTQEDPINLTVATEQRLSTKENIHDEDNSCDFAIDFSIHASEPCNLNNKNNSTDISFSKNDTSIHTNPAKIEKSKETFALLQEQPIHSHISKTNKKIEYEKTKINSDNYLHEVYKEPYHVPKLDVTIGSSQITCQTRLNDDLPLSDPSFETSQPHDLDNKDSNFDLCSSPEKEDVLNERMRELFGEDISTVESESHEIEHETQDILDDHSVASAEKHYLFSEEFHQTKEKICANYTEESENNAESVKHKQNVANVAVEKKDNLNVNVNTCKFTDLNRSEITGNVQEHSCHFKKELMSPRIQKLILYNEGSCVDDKAKSHTLDTSVLCTDKILGTESNGNLQKDFVKICENDVLDSNTKVNAVDSDTINPSLESWLELSKTSHKSDLRLELTGNCDFLETDYDCKNCKALDIKNCDCSNITTHTQVEKITINELENMTSNEKDPYMDNVKNDSHCQVSETIEDKSSEKVDINVTQTIVKTSDDVNKALTISDSETQVNNLNCVIDEDKKESNSPKELEVPDDCKSNEVLTEKTHYENNVTFIEKSLINDVVAISYPEKYCDKGKSTNDCDNLESDDLSQVSESLENDCENIEFSRTETIFQNTCQNETQESKEITCNVSPGESAVTINQISEDKNTFEKIHNSNITEISEFESNNDLIINKENIIQPTDCNKDEGYTTQRCDSSETVEKEDSSKSSTFDSFMQNISDVGQSTLNSIVHCGSNEHIDVISKSISRSEIKAEQSSTEYDRDLTNNKGDKDIPLDETTSCSDDSSDESSSSESEITSECDSSELLSNSVNINQPLSMLKDDITPKNQEENQYPSLTSSDINANKTPSTNEICILIKTHKSILKDLPNKESEECSDSGETRKYLSTNEVDLITENCIQTNPDKTSFIAVSNEDKNKDSEDCNDSEEKTRKYLSTNEVDLITENCIQINSDKTSFIAVSDEDKNIHIEKTVDTSKKLPINEVDLVTEDCIQINSDKTPPVDVFNLDSNLSSQKTTEINDTIQDYQTNEPNSPSPAIIEQDKQLLNIEMNDFSDESKESNNCIDINAIESKGDLINNDSGVVLDSTQEQPNPEYEETSNKKINNVATFDNCENTRYSSRYLSRRRKSLKRSLSDSALDEIKDDIDEEPENNVLLYPNKRKREIDLNSDNTTQLLAENICQVINNHRRNSISSVQNEENVSFCILIDNNCIISEECDDSNKICFSELPEDCLTCVQEGAINEENSSSELIAYTDDKCEYSTTLDLAQEDMSSKEPWVEDIACVETVVTDDIAEDVIISDSNFDDDVDDDIETYELNEHTEKLKYIYGNKMDSDDSHFVDTLYRTPQMDVNRTFHDRESQEIDINKQNNNRILDSGDCTQYNNSSPNTDDTKRYYDSEDLERILSEPNIQEEATSDSGALSCKTPLPSPFISEISSEYPETLGPNNRDRYRFDTPLCDSKEYDVNSAGHIELCKESNVCSNISDKTQLDVVTSCESSIDNVFTYINSEHSSNTSSSPEVSSTTSEERNSGLLLKITKFGESRLSSQVQNIYPMSTISCKYTEKKDYLSSNGNRTLMTKAAQKYIPPLKETICDLKVKLPLPQHSLIKFRQLKLAKEILKPNLGKTANTLKKEVPKKVKPKFEDVLISIDKMQYQKHKEKVKKVKKFVPKVVIKKSENGSHYASTSGNSTFNPDLTGRKWQPWVFLEKDHFIDKMAVKNKTHAIYSYRKKSYVLAEKFQKYKSICNTTFVISQPKQNGSSSGQLKYTIRLKHSY